MKVILGDFEKKELTMLERNGMKQIAGKREDNLRDSNKVETQIRFRATSIETLEAFFSGFSLYHSSYLLKSNATILCDW